MDAAAVATDAAAVDAAAATHLVATVVVASTVAAVAEALEDVAGAASGGGAAAAVYRGARASSARPHGLVAAERAVSVRLGYGASPAGEKIVLVLEGIGDDKRTYVTAFQDEVTALQPISGPACAKAVESAQSEGRGEAGKDGSGVSDH
jgi:hypothetical protein